MTLISFSWTYNQYWVPVSAYHGSLLFIVYTQVCHSHSILPLPGREWFSLTNKLDLLRVFVFARQVTTSGAMPAGLLYLTTNSSKLVEIPQSVQSISILN
nr:MAG TPA: hypothetical protein [Caudoviricetes sp.]